MVNIVTTLPHFGPLLLYFTFIFVLFLPKENGYLIYVYYTVCEKQSLLRYVIHIYTYKLNKLSFVYIC